MYRGDIVETSADGGVADALVSYHGHGNAENAADTTMMEELYLGFISCGHCPLFVAPEECGEYAGFVDHSLGPHFHLGAAPEEAEGAHDLVSFEDAAGDVGGVTQRAVYEGSKVDKLGGSSDSATCGCGKRPCRKEGRVCIDEELHFLIVAE